MRANFRSRLYFINCCYFDDSQLHDYCRLAHELGMAVLVESHTQKELERALLLPTPLMGINNRDLHTFKTDLHTSINLATRIPSDKIIVSESGIHHHKDISLLLHHGIKSYLIGESLLRQGDPGKI